MCTDGVTRDTIWRSLQRELQHFTYDVTLWALVALHSGIERSSPNFQKYLYAFRVI